MLIFVIDCKLKENRSLLDVGIGNLKDLIKYKVTEAGGFYIEVPTKKVKPSQTCPNCGHQKKKTLAQREHHCEKCGYRCDRDVAAAMVMLNHARGMERASTDSDESTSTWCGSFKQVAQVKSRKRVSSAIADTRSSLTQYCTAILRVDAQWLLEVANATQKQATVKLEN
ncbi:MAG: transposase [Calothrix sp. MO_192.B10]|nr:transposase [Calothrix sp. MO_192.B10]